MPALRHACSLRHRLLSFRDARAAAAPRPSAPLCHHRHFACRAAAAAGSGGGDGAPPPAPRVPHVVFLGTPACAVIVLDALILASSPSSPPLFELAAVVSQPARAKGRGRGAPTPSPVAERALAAGVPLLTPDKPNSPEFLSAIAALQPALCITAAYGCMLPRSFLSVPSCGTLNVHPSLLPRYRGAAPVQRCIEAGETTTGVSVAYTVLKCDAGPVLASKEVPLDGTETSAVLLDTLFSLGSRLLVDALPAVLRGEVSQSRCAPQEEAGAVGAPKVGPADALLDPRRHSAPLCERKVRAFGGWPGARIRLRVGGEPLLLKVHAACVVSPSSDEQRPLAPSVHPSEVVLAAGALRVTCADGSVLGLTTVQPPSGVAMPAAAWAAGLRGRAVTLDKEDAGGEGARE